MAEITAQVVNEFRKRTGLGLMECKALLKEVDGDLKKAELLAKEKGVLKAASRSGRATNAGRVEVLLSPDGKSGAAVLLTCETDFVARNDDFQAAAKLLARQVLEHGTDTPVADQKFVGDPSKTVKEMLTELNARTGENVALAGAARLVATGAGRVDSYVHHDARTGAIVLVEAEDDGVVGSDEVRQLVKDLALQVVAARPVGTRREDVPADLVEENRQVFANQVENQQGSKPANIREKIAEGMLNKWYSDLVLLEQEFVKDPAKKVRDVVAAAGKALSVRNFARFEVAAAPVAGE